uniref:Amidase domain-containing protein n=1 Tax=Aegilops tauschii subsp. strangulata TaxID=200361 RepID=A0A453HM00_AEGTS
SIIGTRTAQLCSSMGLVCSAPKVYKPAAEVDLGPDSDEHYISPNVKAPRVAGLPVKMFAWVLETPVLGPLLLYVLKKDNLVNKLVSDADIPEPPLFTPTHTWQDIPEQNVSLAKPGWSPAARAQEAIDCLPDLADPSSPGFRRWKIRDFAKAYSSGEITPVMVARRFLAAVEECSGPDLNMALFISYDPEDIVRQAEESTLRYQQGGASVCHGWGAGGSQGRDRLPALPNHWRHELAGKDEAVRGGRGVRGAAAGLRRRPGRQDQHARARRRHQRHQPAPRLHQEPLPHRQGVGRLVRRLRRRRLRRPLPRRSRRRRRRIRTHARGALRRRRLQAHRGAALQLRASPAELDGGGAGDLGGDGRGRTYRVSASTLLA